MSKHVHRWHILETDTQPPFEEYDYDRKQMVRLQDPPAFESIFLCDCGAWKTVKHLLSKEVNDE